MNIFTTWYCFQDEFGDQTDKNKVDDTQLYSKVHTLLLYPRISYNQAKCAEDLDKEEKFTSVPRPEYLAGVLDHLSPQVKPKLWDIKSISI